MTAFLDDEERETLSMFFWQTGLPRIITMIDIMQSRLMDDGGRRPALRRLLDKGLIEPVCDLDAVGPSKAGGAYWHWLQTKPDADDVVTVPTEPTYRMIDFAWEVTGGVKPGRADPAFIYRAMIAARPDASEKERQTVDRALAAKREAVFDSIDRALSLRTSGGLTAFQDMGRSQP